MEFSRRGFLAATLPAGLTGMVAGSAAWGAVSASDSASAPFAFDAMGELRLEYGDDLLTAMRSSGLSAITVTLGDPRKYEEDAYQDALQALDEYDAHIADNPHWFIKATRADDALQAHRDSRIAVFYLFQNTTQFGRDLDRVNAFYERGVRSAQMTYNDQNWAGSGCWEPNDGGLSLFGHALVERMNEVSMLIDVSHAGMRTLAETVAASAVPIINSHASCRSVHPHIRSTTDENLRAVAERGGVTGICQIRPFLTDRREGALEAYFAHIDHAVNVCGIEHVAIGSDRDHRVIEMSEEYLESLRREMGAAFNDADWPLFIDQLNGPARMNVIRDGLRARGYSQGDTDKIMGANLLRLYRDVIG
ncbi:dipeptidase [Glycocaulis alkaliphilus]|nr:membrane dipeptidase [Glycocaulis alkaliphilus]GGB76241.1 dipeptidase [Glycocaulis alkaliphilus]